MNDLDKSVLVVSPFFFPEPISTGKFNTDLVILLRERVKSITVLCSHPFYPKWKVKESIDQIENIRIIRGGRHIRYTKCSIGRRLILELWFAFFILKKFLKSRNNFDLIVFVYPPNMAFLWIRAFIKKDTKTVALVHDLQGVYTARKKGLWNKGVNFFVNKIEKNALKFNKRIIFLSEEMKETAQKKYALVNDKLSVCYPFVTLNRQHITDDLENILSGDYQHIVYSGALGEKQNPNKLYSFFDFASKRMENTVFHIFSEGTFYEKLKTLNRNNNVRFHNLVPISSLSELYRRSTLQIIPQLPGTSKGSLPSKLPNILASGCRTMVITDKGSEIEYLFKKHNLNTVVTNWENEVLFSNLEKAIKIPKTEDQIDIAIRLFGAERMIEKILT